MAEDQAPKPYYKSMAKQTVGREELYWKVSPPEDPITINVEPFDLDDLVPEDVDIRAVVAGIQNGRSGESRGIRAEHMKV